jgi:hypothetical protein
MEEQRLFLRISDGSYRVDRRRDLLRIFRGTAVAR